MLPISDPVGPPERHTRPPTLQWARACAVRVGVTDGVLALVLGVLACGLCLAGSARINPQLVLSDSLWNVWFDADPSVYYVSMTNRVGGHWGSNVHPLLAFFMYLPVFALTRGLGLAKPAAAQVLMALVAAAWVFLHFVMARLFACRRVDAALLAVLAGTSAGAMFMFVVPEFHPFGGVTVTLCLVLAARNQNRRVTTGELIGINALSATGTVTNWALGALICHASGGVRRALTTTMGAAALLAAASLAQHAIFPTATMFLWRSAGYAVEFARIPTPLRLAETTAGLLYHPVVMPRIGTLGASAQRRVGSAQWPYRALSVQQSLPGSGSTWGVVAVVLWTVLLGRGAMVWYRSHRRWLVLPIALAIQALLYLVFGDEMFLFTLNWLPFLLSFAALGLAASRGIAMRIVLAGLIVANAANNIGQFQLAADMLSHPERHPALAVPVSAP